MVGSFYHREACQTLLTAPCVSHTSLSAEVRGYGICNLVVARIRTQGTDQFRYSHMPSPWPELFES